MKEAKACDKQSAEMEQQRLESMMLEALASESVTLTPQELRSRLKAHISKRKPQK